MFSFDTDFTDLQKQVKRYSDYLKPVEFMKFGSYFFLDKLWEISFKISFTATPGLSSLLLEKLVC
jgi:hypothetical protein